MTRRIQRDQNLNRHTTVAVIGDSIAFNYTLGCFPDEFWPERAGVALRALDSPARVKVRNFGVSGNTSTQALARKEDLTRYDVPTLALIDVGRNDPGSSIVGATTQSNIEALIAHVVAAGATFVGVVSAHYLNFSTGGDTLNTPYSTYATLRTFQQAAAVAAAITHADDATVFYVDAYAGLRALVAAGTPAELDWDDWHVADGNQHLTVAGEQALADVIVDDLTGRTALMTALRR